MNNYKKRFIALIEKKVDPNEAPPGFFAAPKVYKGENICRQCDARSLCIENKDDWCINNRCMEASVFSTKYRKIIERKDGVSVVFKRHTPQLELEFKTKQNNHG